MFGSAREDRYRSLIAVSFARFIKPSLKPLLILNAKVHEIKILFALIAEATYKANRRSQCPIGLCNKLGNLTFV